MRVAMIMFLLALQMIYVQYEVSGIKCKVKQLQGEINADGE